MIGALVRSNNGIMKIVTGYKCDASCEFVHAGDGATTWYPLYDYEILSIED